MNLKNTNNPTFKKKVQKTNSGTLGKRLSKWPRYSTSHS